MAKRKADAKDPKNKMDVDNDSGSDDDQDMIDVDFEWFDPNSEIDFHGTKALLRQLFDVDNTLIEISGLTDLLLTSPTVGSTVKCDGEESDPFAIVSLLNLTQHRDSPAVQSLNKYLSSQSTKSSGALANFQSLLSPTSGSRIALIVSERLINMPHQIVPSLYSILESELATSKSEDPQNFSFTHFLIVSRTYTEVESKLDGEDSRPSKKNKAAKNASSELFYFHPEDEIIGKHAIDVLSYEFTNHKDEGASDARRTFQELGVRPQGHMMLLEAAKLPEVVKAIAAYLNET